VPAPVRDLFFIAHNADATDGTPLVTRITSTANSTAQQLFFLQPREFDSNAGRNRSRVMIPSVEGLAGSRRRT
jgi:hypothetical protein